MTKTEKALAPKQQKVLDLLNAGKTPTEVAKKLKISVNGVYGHMRRIEAKGYEVPRSTRPKAKKAKAKVKASTNGSGSVHEIDGGIAKLIEQAVSRQNEIKAEADRISAEQQSLTERLSVLHNESAALAARQKALASV